MTGVLLATLALNGVSAKTLHKFGLTEQSRVGKLLAQIAPHSFNPSHNAPALNAKTEAAAPATQITVTTTSDAAGSCPGATCTLRAAITLANATAGADTINFNIPGAGSSGSLVRGLVVNGFIGQGMRFNSNANNNTVAGNRIGVQANGVTALRNDGGVSLSWAIPSSRMAILALTSAVTTSRPMTPTTRTRA